MRVVLCLIGGLLLSGCSGGGGGGGGGGDGGRSGFSIQLQQSSVSLEYRDGSPSLPTTDLVATWRGTPPNPLYIFAIVEGTGIAPPSISINEVEGRARLTATRLPPGDHTGRIIIRACPDPNCSSTVGGTPLNVPYTVRVTPAAVTSPGLGAVSSVGLTHRLGQPVPARTLNVASGAGAWTATASASWITLSQASGTGGAAVVLGVRPELLTTPSIQGTVTFSTGNLGTQTISVYVSVSVPSISTSPQVMFLDGVAGAPLSASQQFDVQIDSGSTLPMTVSSDQSWIRISSVAGAAPGSFVMSLDSSASSLPSGTHNGYVTVHLEGGVTDVERDIQVQLRLARAEFTAPATVVLGGNSGRNFDPVPLALSLNTGSNAYAWTVSSPPNWLQIDHLNGSIGQSGETLTLQPVYAQSTPGLATTSLLFTTTVNGEVITRTVPVEFGLDARRLIASEVGIAFTELPGTNRDELTRTIKVRDNYNQNIPWTASEDASWLTVTSSGMHGGDLVITANPTGLQSDELHEARIRISTSESSIQQDEYVRVGLWIGTSMPSTNRVLHGMYWEAVGDPIRPYVYAREHNEAAIRVFHAYTGTQIGTITGIPLNTLHLAVSRDGQTLYALAGLNIVPVNLTTYAVGAPFVLASSSSGARQKLTYARPNGVGVLLDDRGGAHLAATGERVGGAPFSDFGVSGDDRWVFSAESRRAIDFSQSRGNQFLMTQAGEIALGGVESTPLTATNFDGSKVYVMRAGNGGVRRLLTFNGLTLGSVVELQTPTGFSNLLVTRHGQAIFTDISTYTNDLTIYNPDNSVALTNVALGDSGFDLSATGDGNFALACAYNMLTIVPIPR